MRTLIFSVLAWMVGALLAPLPPVARTVKHNLHPCMKRVYGSVTEGVSSNVRSFAIGIARAFFEPLGSRAGILNMFLDPLPDFDYQASRDKKDLPEGVYLESILLRISGTLTVSGGTSDGTLMTDGPVARLIDELTVRWDGFDLVKLLGRDLAALSRRIQSQGLSGTEVTAAGVQTTNFDKRMILPFTRAYLADQFDTVLPPLRVGQEFVLEVKWNTDTSNSNASTTQGSGALISGGDRDVVLSDVKLEATPIKAQSGKKPWMLPVISTYETAQFTAANPRLPFSFDGVKPFDSILYRCFDGANEDPEGAIQNILLEAANTDILDDVPVEMLRILEEQLFPAVQESAETGTHFVRYADGGKLGNIIRPAELTNPRHEFDVAAPGSSPGFIRLVVMELMPVPGVTRMEE